MVYAGQTRDFFFSTIIGLPIKRVGITWGVAFVLSGRCCFFRVSGPGNLHPRHLQDCISESLNDLAVSVKQQALLRGWSDRTLLLS